MIDREFVRTHRRRRLTLAVAESVSERGYAATSVTDIVRAAGVARNTFYEEFANKEAVFLALLEESYAELLGLSRKACAETGDEPEERIRAGLGAVLAWIDQNPASADSCLVEAPCAGESARELKVAVEDRFAGLLGDAGISPGPGPPQRTAMLVGGVVAMLLKVILDGEKAVDRHGEFASFLTLGS